MKPHVSGFIGHNQVSTIIKISLYKLCEGVLMKRSLCINPLFTMFLVQMLYVNNEKVYPIGSMEIRVFVLGLHKLLWPGLAIVFVLSSLRGDPL
jgi:hypothetical protein